MIMEKEEKVFEGQTIKRDKETGRITGGISEDYSKICISKKLLRRVDGWWRN
jgi:hypothetical protein